MAYDPTAANAALAAADPVAIDTLGDRRQVHIDLSGRSPKYFPAQLGHAVKPGITLHDAARLFGIPVRDAQR